MENQPKIFVFLPTATILHREMLEGILSYAHQNGPWHFHLELEDFNRQPLNRIRYWGCTGIIALVRSHKEARRLFRTGLPTVFIGASTNLSKPGEDVAVAAVQRDEEAVGRAAAEYYIKRQYHSFAYVGTSEQTPWSRRRQIGFAQRVKEEGFDCKVFPRLEGSKPEDYASESKRLCGWLATLPHPTGVFVVHDRRAQQILSCALEARLSVPHDIAILGVDDDQLLCTTASPTISSISLNGHGTGMIAAELLHRLMRGEPCERIVNPVTPVVTTRESTEASAVEDPILSRALALIEKEYANNFNLDDFCRRLNCSKRTLELKAKHILGTTISKHLMHVRLSAAKRLLASTTLPVAQIAAQTGFCSASHLGARLTAATGHSSKHFRP